MNFDAASKSPGFLCFCFLDGPNLTHSTHTLRHLSHVALVFSWPKAKTDWFLTKTLTPKQVTTQLRGIPLRSKYHLLLKHLMLFLSKPVWQICWKCLYIPMAFFVGSIPRGYTGINKLLVKICWTHTADTCWMWRVPTVRLSEGSGSCLVRSCLQNYVLSMPTGLPVQLNWDIRWFMDRINITFSTSSDASEYYR